MRLILALVPLTFLATAALAQQTPPLPVDPAAPAAATQPPAPTQQSVPAAGDAHSAPAQQQPATVAAPGAAPTAPEAATQQAVAPAPTGPRPADIRQAVTCATLSQQFGDTLTTLTAPTAKQKLDEAVAKSATAQAGAGRKACMEHDYGPGLDQLRQAIGQLGKKPVV